MKKSKNLLPENLTILLLEDMENIRKTMLEDLQIIGVENNVLEAPCVKDAIAICNKQEIGFIISDWNLPDGTGLDFLKKLRGTKKFAQTPFLMCTTMDEVEDILNAINEGASEYLVKPWKREELLKKINDCWKATQD